MDSVIDIISWVGVIQGMLLVLLLATRKNNRNANRLLAIFIAIITLDCLEPLIFERGYSGWFFKTWEFLWGGIVFLHGPLLFLYVKKMTTGAESFTRSDLKHYSLPFIYFGIILSALIIPFSERDLELAALILHELFFLHLLTYSIASLISLKRFQKNLKHGESTPDFVNLTWLKILLVTTLSLYIISFVTAQIGHFDPTHSRLIWDTTIQFVLVMIMYIISYKSISQPEIFFMPEQKVDGVLKEKYKTSSLDDENAQRIRQKLILFMKEKKPFLDPNLSLEMLARQVGESRYHVSQVINDNLKTKFNDFVNQYRVEEFKRLAVQPRRRKPTVEALARLSGFNSKTSFHTVFKKMTGKTPSKFYKETLAVEGSTK